MDDQYIFQESDWKTFRAKLQEWHEAYLERMNREYAEILSKPGKASDKFRALEKRINRDKYTLSIDIRMSHSNMYYHLTSLLERGVIKPEDLNDFSSELRKQLDFVIKKGTGRTVPVVEEGTGRTVPVVEEGTGRTVPVVDPWWRNIWKDVPF